MKTSPLAGTQMEPGMLVNVPRLVTAYYTEAPDPAVTAQRVAFGTSGHRGSSFKRAFNEWHILAISHAICLYRAQHKIDGPLFLGIDTHALSASAHVSALEVLAANGVEVMIAFRRTHSILRKEEFYTDAEMQWYGPQGELPNWADLKEKQFACLIHEDERSVLYLMFNASTAAVDLGLPRVPPGTRWHLVVDTSREAPRDLFTAGEEPLWENTNTYHLSPRSRAILLGRGTNVQARQTPLMKTK